MLIERFLVILNGGLKGSSLAGYRLILLLSSTPCSRQTRAEVGTIVGCGSLRVQWPVKEIQGTPSRFDYGRSEHNGR